MAHCAPDTTKRGSAQTSSATGIPQSLLFFILKQLETSRPDERQGPDEQ